MEYNFNRFGWSQFFDDNVGGTRRLAEACLTRQTPPTFLLQAWDDPVNDVCNSVVYARALDAAGVPSEVHLFASGGHAFGLRRNQSPDTAWPPLVENWLRERGVLGEP
mgnify:CR=1 FL=1